MRTMIAVALVVFFGSIGSVAADAQAAPQRPEIWFSPLQASLNPAGRGLVFNLHDFPAMVASPNAWEKTAARISVLRLNAQGIIEQYPDVPSVIGMVNKLNLPIVAGGTFVHTSGRCLVHGEGASNDVGYERELVSTLHSWKLAGGRLDYVIMDGPLWFGYYGMNKACHFSIEDAANSAADTLRMIKKDYPDIKIVDAEGPAWLSLNTWLPELDRFWQAFRLASGTPVSYLMMDMHWVDAWHNGYNWIDATRQIGRFVQALGVKTGLSVNADDRFVEHGGRVAPDEQITEDMWMQENREHLRAIRDAKLPLDFIIINDWMKFPQRNLPEADQNAYTSLVGFAYSLWSR